MSAQIAEQAIDFEIEIGSSNTEYALELPASTKALEFRVRDGTAIIYSFTEGQSIAPALLDRSRR